MKRIGAVTYCLTGLALFSLGAAAGYLCEAATASAAEMSGGKSYFLPVSSRQLQISIVPLKPSETALAALPAAASGAKRVAQELTSASGLAALADDVAKFYRVQCEVDVALTIPDECFDFQRQQYDTRLLLKWLNKQAAPGSFRTAGVLSTDVYTEGYNFLFGQARLGGSACVVSAARMGMDVGLRSPETRWQAIVRHELGHTLGLQHVNDPRSVMKYANSLAEHDLQGTGLTAYDWKQLKALHPIEWKE